MRKKIEILGLIALLILITNCNSIIQVNADEKSPSVEPYTDFSWPMYGHDPAHTGYSNSIAPSTNFTFLEKQIQFSSSFTFLVKHIQFSSSPIVVDGKIYGSGSETACLNAYNGEILWHKPIKPQYSMAPSLRLDP